MFSHARSALISSQRLNAITATLREPAGPEDTPEKLEEERVAAQEFIDNGQSYHLFNVAATNIRTPTAVPLDDDEQAQKEAYLDEGFPDWSRRDFQQFVRALEANGWWAQRFPA